MKVAYGLVFFTLLGNLSAQQENQSCMSIKVQRADLPEEERRAVMRAEVVGNATDLTLAITVTNISDHSVVRVDRGTFTPSDAEQGVRLDLRNAAGQAEEESQAGWQMHSLTPHSPSTKGQSEMKAARIEAEQKHLGSGSIFSAPVTVAAGESFTVYRNLAHEYALKSDERYTLRASVQDACSGRYITSEPLSIP